jgi:predicted ATPase
MGNVVDVSTLTMVHGQPEPTVHDALWAAVRAGFIIHIENTYRFLHDRIQQAAYSLIPEPHRADLHLRIGRVLLGGMTVDQLAEHLFDVVNQFKKFAPKPR